MMHELDKQMKSVRAQLGQWAKKAKQEYPAHLEDSVRHAVDKLDPAGLARASEEVVATVTGNRKAARRARKSVEQALVTAQRRIGTKRARGSGTLAVLGIVALIGLAAAVVLRKAVGPHGRNPGPAGPNPASHTRPVDPDLGT
ncbi:MAG: hypothetical protein WCC45_17500 [Paeniglutamicibacter sp.]